MEVNIDALISREDFEIKDETNSSSKVQTIQIRDLETSSFFYQTLRKPDFQRETSEWSAEKICDFIQSFLDGDLIPSIILWNSGGYNFVIDGAHRLSALASWVIDDYGDGAISQSFFRPQIPQEQVEIAERARRLIKRKIGSYQDHKYAISNPDKVPSEILSRARKLGTLAIQLQWVDGDSSKAEASFFKINQQATPINDTEIRLLKARKKANAMAARAIIRSGTGHKYWHEFSEEIQKEIEQIAKEINSMLFTPSLQTPIKTLDLPLAGRGYSSQTLSLVFDLINISNSIKSDEGLDNDVDGTGTVKILKNTRRVLYRITSTHPSSLGLHPAVFFYSASGRYQVTAFLAVVELIKELELRDNFKEFSTVRSKFEDFLIRYKGLVNQVNLKHGSGLKGYRKLKELFETIINCLLNEKNNAQIISALSENSSFSYLKPEAIEFDFTNRKEFSTETKSGAFIREALQNPLRCPICSGLIHKNSITIDHIERIADGGRGNLDNAQLAHPFCNSTIKN